MNDYRVLKTPQGVNLSVNKHNTEPPGLYTCLVVNCHPDEQWLRTSILNKEVHFAIQADTVAAIIRTALRDGDEEWGVPGSQSGFNIHAQDGAWRWAIYINETMDDSLRGMYQTYQGIPKDVLIDFANAIDEQVSAQGDLR